MGEVGRPKGQNKTGGRAKGTPNRSTKQIREVLEPILKKEVKKLPNLLEGLEPYQKIEALAKLLPYVAPKLNSVEFGENQELIQVNLNLPDNNRGDR